LDDRGFPGSWVITTYLLDDERPAIERLARMLEATGRVQIIGSSTDAVDALADISRVRPDVLFLDICMPGLSGFEVLAQLVHQPLIVFTTAHDQYALEAFEADSIAYLVKPIDAEHLDRALAKADRFLARDAHHDDLRTVLGQITAVLQARSSETWLSRLASRIGDKITVVDLRSVTHLYAKDKVTFAATLQRDYIVDQTVVELEEKLDPARFVRIHRGVILNLDHLAEVHRGFGGRLIVRLKDTGRTELTVSRDRARALKTKLGLSRP
jgi:two-component system LytT family response regulator